MGVWGAGQRDEGKAVLAEQGGGDRAREGGGRAAEQHAVVWSSATIQLRRGPALSRGAVHCSAAVVQQVKGGGHGALCRRVCESPLLGCWGVSRGGWTHWGTCNKVGYAVGLWGLLQNMCTAIRERWQRLAISRWHVAVSSVPRGSQPTASQEWGWRAPTEGGLTQFASRGVWLPAPALPPAATTRASYMPLAALHCVRTCWQRWLLQH